MTKSNAIAAYAVAKFPVPILVDGWTQDPVFLWEKYFHPEPKTLEEFYGGLNEFIRVEKNGEVLFDEPFQGLEDIIIDGHRFEFDEIHTYLHYCYDHGRLSEEDLAAFLVEQAVKHPERAWKEERCEVA